MIPEAAVEAAAKAIYERCGLLWANVEPEWRDDELAHARAALEAAAPHMLAEAWEAGREVGLDQDFDATTQITNPYRTTK